MQHQRVEPVDTEVLEGAVEGLLDLDLDGRRGVVRQAVVLATTMGELGLKEEFVPSDETVGERLA